MTQEEALKLALDLATMHHTDDGYAELRAKVRSASKEALAQPEQEPVAIDQATMELAESVGLIGPTSRTHDLHQAIQRFHDLICVNATVKAAQMAADVIRESTPPQRAEQEPVAWFSPSGNLYKTRFHATANGEQVVTPLYTAPPQRKPLVWLSEEDERQIKDHCTTVACVLRATKAKLKEKNT